MQTIARVFVLCLLPALASAQPVQVLHAFGVSPGAPNGALLEAPDGSFYGTSATGIYRRAPDGQVTLFARADFAVGALLRGSDGALYGVTGGGPNGAGTVFRVDPLTGDLRTLHAFTGGNDGGAPLGGLVEVGGQLYGVTRSGGPAAAPSSPSGTIFRIDPSTGAFTVLHAFLDLSTIPANVPWGPLALGPDGMLYGTTRFGGAEEAGTIYRLNPATGAFAIVHAMTVAEGIGPVGPLLLDSDGAFYGSAYAGGDDTGSGTIFRFDPATSQLQRLYSFTGATDGSLPGPLVKAADGHLYGTTDYGPVPAGSPRTPTFFRLRRSPAVSFETLRTFDPATTGRGEKVQLMLGTDARLYGYAQTDGPTATGTIYRFDPLAGGPPSDPLSFTVLHTFPPEASSPSGPTLSADGFLYGTTRAGGATGRGRVYRLSRETGAVTLLGTLPGGPAQTASWNSPLVAGADGLLYGTSHSETDTVNENRIVRVDPASGTASAAHERTDPRFPSVFYASGPLARLSGALFGLRFEGASLHAFRFDTQTNAVTDVAFTPAAGNWWPTSLLAATDGQLYLTSVFAVSTGLHTFRHDAQLRRVNLAAGTVDLAVALGTASIVSPPVQGPGATVYVGASNGGNPRVLLVDLQTNQVRPVCTIASQGYIQTLSVASDGTLFGTLLQYRQERFHCNPVTGATSVEFQSPEIGGVAEPFTTVPLDGLSYGAGSSGGPAGGGTLFRMAPTLTPPALDSDTDGLSNIWETTYGLDPFSSAADAGATGDPDQDGRTNAQELADGTHPRGTVTRYFAEGATGAFFHTRFDLGNPQQATPAIARVRFLTNTGVTVAHDVIVPPSSHVSIDPATLPGLANETFSTIVEADATVAVDRTMTWDASGYGSHIETGLVAPSTTWYFAEGSTSGDFWLFYLLQNPEATAVTATVRFLRPAGAPIERTYTLAPHSRTTIPVDFIGPELVSTDVSAVITATAPIVAERAMYLSRPGQPFGAGHESAGVTAPALEWFLAEGATGAFFDLFVLIANPGATDAAVTVEYLLVGGGSLTKTYTVPANSRTTIWVDDEQLPAGSGQRPLANVAVSTAVRSTNNVPIIVERAMWWPGPALTENYWYEAHNSPGATSAATRWITGGGEIGGADGAETYVLIANTTTTPGRARVTLLSDSGATYRRDYDLPAKSRTNVPIGHDFALTLTRFAIVVESLGVPPVPIVVERATYASPGGVLWGSGGNALAAPLP